jgi:biotin synthase
MPLLANTDDFTLEQAHQIKAAGFNGCYHAVRMGEGVVTGIPVETRLTTFKHIHEAGLSLSTCVEPVGPEHTPEELTEKTRICIESGAQSAGLGRRIGVPGTQLFDKGMISSWRASLYIAVYRLACGIDPRLNCAGGYELSSAFGANLAWAEVGTNPRDTLARTEDGGEGWDIAFCREQFINSGWELLEGPSPGWIL